MTDSAPSRTMTFRRRLRRWRPYMIAASVVFALGLWLTFQHKPGWYRPVEASEAVVARARREAPNLVDQISGALVRGETIAVTLREDQVNEWLAALPVAWPEFRELIPAGVTQPTVRITEEGLRVGCHLESSGWKVIVGVVWHVAVVEGGASVEIRLGSVQAGSLPIPAAVLKPMLNRALAQEGGGGNQGSTVRSADELFEGVRMENRFEWPNGRRLFRIGRLTTGDKELVIVLHPLPMPGKSKRR